LWDFNANAFHALQEVFSCYGLHLSNVRFLDFFRVYSDFNRGLWDAWRQGKVVKNELICLRFQYTIDKLQIRNIDPDEMNELYLIEMSKQKRLIDGTENLLSYLKLKGYKLFIITNGFTRMQHKKMESSGIKDYFGKIYISEEIKSAKPAKKIFEYALKSSNARKSGSLMIGDNFETDITGALDFGMDAMYLELSGKKEIVQSFTQIQCKRNFYKVHSLSDIKLIL